MRTRIQPLFKWTGSKQRMLDLYTPHFFPETPPTRFVDLFAGALTMTLWMAERYPSCQLVINDANEELILLYRTLASNTEGVIARWQECVDGWVARSRDERKSYYYDLRETYCHAHQDKTTEYLSGMLLFMLSVNFNGMWKSYHKCANRYSTPPGSCTQGAGFFTTDNIRAVAEVLRRAEIHCGSYADAPVRAGDYIYADPPYRQSSVDYQCGFTEDNQTHLARFLTSHDGLYAYSNKEIGDDFYTTHFPDAHIYTLPATYTAGRGDAVSVSEVLITNFNSTTSQPFTLY